MILKKFYKKYSTVNILIISVLIILGISLLYFFYHLQRNQEDVYVRVSLIRPYTNQQAPDNWAPYWIANTINIGDKEVSPLGGLLITVEDNQNYEGIYSGKLVYLLLKVKAIHDRSGAYLFKNKPLSVGSTIDINLTNTQFKGLIVYIGKNKPVDENKNMIITVEGKEWWPYLTDSVIIGSTIVDNKGEVIAKILDKKTSNAEVRADSAGGVANVSYDRRKRDIVITLSITVKKVNDYYYFMETQKVKVNENLYLPFKEAGTVTLPITSIKEIKEFSE